MATGTPTWRPGVQHGDRKSNIVTVRLGSVLFHLPPKRDVPPPRLLNYFRCPTGSLASQPRLPFFVPAKPTA